MADRYFAASPIEGSRTSLAGAEAHHLAHVMRAAPGDVVVVFDGSGAEFTARIDAIGRSEIELTVLSRTAVERELPVPITLGVALPKGDRQRWLIEKTVELGVVRLVPLEPERAVERSTDAAVARLRRAVIEASKQCGRNRLMEIAAPQSLTDFLDSAPAETVRLIAHPGGDALASAIDRMSLNDSSAQVAIAIGPEGGFSPGEIEAAVSRGWQAIDLGRRILRVETAALALVAAITSRLERG